MFDERMSADVENDVEKEQRQKSEIIVMLGASLHNANNENNKEGYDHFPLHVKGNDKANLRNEDDEPVEVVGGDVRMRAIEILASHNNEECPDKDINIFTTGGFEKDGKSRATAAKQKLINKYGLSEDEVHALPSGGTTMGNASALERWAKNHKEDVGDLEEIKIVTNGFHMVRAWAMFTHAIHKEKTGENLAEQMSIEDKNKISDILRDTLSNVDSGDREALNKIQGIYAPYLHDDSVKIIPVIAEDVIESSGESKSAEASERIKALQNEITLFGDNVSEKSIEEISSFAKKLNLSLDEFEKIALEGKAKLKYAKVLRRDDLVQKARVNERKGLNDLLANKYQVR